MKNFVLTSIIVLFAGCVDTEINSDRQLAVQTEKSMREANSQIGMPAIINFQEKKLAKMIYELRDKENYVCYAYLYNRNTGQVGQFLGRCLGYGLPYCVQFSNPEKVVEGDKQLGYDLSGIPHIMTLPQSEPNGLFMPEGLSATWLMLLDKEGKPRPVYVEPEIIVSPFPLHEEQNAEKE